MAGLESRPTKESSLEYQGAMGNKDEARIK